jgi:tetratricopeptide (TPR) repeat protein
VKSVYSWLAALLLIAPSLAAVTNVAGKAKSTSGTSTNTVPSAVEAEYQKLLELDQAALDEVDRWIKEANEFEAKGAGTPRSVLVAKIEQRLEPIKKAYEDFLRRNPKHVEARLAYGSFLNETGEEEEAILQWEKAREIDPKEPAAWNNLANVYGHIGPIEKAFEYYEKAIELDPKEPVYLQNFATTTYLFRKDARERYKITEREVFNKALGLYQKALALDPDNFLLATDLAQSYYGIKPLRRDEAIKAWDYAMAIAKSDLEKQGVHLHLARVKLNSGMFDEAQKHLDQVTIEELNEMKTRLQRNIDQKRSGKQPLPEKEEGEDFKFELVPPVKSTDNQPKQETKTEAGPQAKVTSSK